MEQTQLPPNYAFRDDQFLRTYGLTLGWLVDGYFKNSPFYDNTCLNNELIMKNKDMSLLTQLDGVSYRLSLVQFRDGTTLTGDELSLPENQTKDITSALAVINKVRHISGDETEGRVLAKYYVVDSTVYQAPTIYYLITTKIRSSIFYLRESIREYNKLFKWDIESGYYPSFIPDNEDSALLLQNEFDFMNQDIASAFEMQNAMFATLIKEMDLDQSQKQ